MLRITAVRCLLATERVLICGDYLGSVTDGSKKKAEFKYFVKTKCMYRVKHFTRQRFSLMWVQMNAAQTSQIPTLVKEMPCDRWRIILHSISIFSVNICIGKFSWYNGIGLK